MFRNCQKECIRHNYCFNCDLLSYNIECLLLVSIEYYINLQALWQLLWVIPSSSTQKVSPNTSGLKKLSVENVKTRARAGLSELLTQVSNLVLIPCYYFFYWFLWILVLGRLCFFFVVRTLYHSYLLSVEKIPMILYAYWITGVSLGSAHVVGCRLTGKTSWTRCCALNFCL